jgi:hypothetical protein
MRWRYDLICVSCVVLAACGGEAADSPQTTPDMSSEAPEMGADSGAGMVEDQAAGADLGEEPGADMMEPDQMPDLAPPLVSVFVAQGHLGRTTRSCDGGQTWGAERSDDAAAKCWSMDGKPDCDHTSGAGRGIAADADGFLATFGWGEPGAVKRSADGASWVDVLPGFRFGGVAHGSGVWLAASRDPQRSLDGGRTWELSGPSMMRTGNVRRAAFVEAGGGLFIMVGDDSDVVTSPDAKTWSAAAVPAGCGKNIQTEGGIASRGDVILILGGDGSACRSADGGQTWTMHSAGADLSSHLVVHAGQFKAWSRGKVYASADGAAWSAADITPNNIAIGPAAASPEGALVGVRGGWQVWYERQEFYRSQDGVSWEILPAGSFTGGHPIRAIAHGYTTRCD